MPTITKADIVAASEGMLHKDLFVVLTTPANGMGPVMDNLGPHLEYQQKIERDGIMFGAGPFWLDDETTWNGEGMVIIRAQNLAHAREIAANDPMHASGARTFTVRPWLLNEGSYTVTMTYSNGKIAVR